MSIATLYPKQGKLPRCQAVYVWMLTEGKKLKELFKIVIKLHRMQSLLPKCFAEFQIFYLPYIQSTSSALIHIFFALWPQLAVETLPFPPPTTYYLRQKTYISLRIRRQFLSETQTFVLSQNKSISMLH